MGSLFQILLRCCGWLGVCPALCWGPGAAGETLAHTCTYICVTLGCDGWNRIHLTSQHTSWMEKISPKKISCGEFVLTLKTRGKWGKTLLTLKMRGPPLSPLHWAFIPRSLWFPDQGCHSRAFQECMYIYMIYQRNLSNKALNRENQLECIQQSIKVRFDHHLRA